MADYKKKNFYPIEFIERLGYLYDRGLSLEDIALKMDIPERICKGLLYYKTCNDPVSCGELRKEFLERKYPSRNELESVWRKKGFSSTFLKFGLYGLNSYRMPLQYKEFEFNSIDNSQYYKKINSKSKFKELENRIKALIALRYNVKMKMEDNTMEKNFNVNENNTTNTKIMSFKNKVINAIALMAIINSENKVEFPDFVSQEERDRALSFVQSKIKTEPEDGKLGFSNFGYYFLSNVSTLLDNLERPSKSEYIQNLVSYIKAYQENFETFISAVKAEVKKRERKDNNSIDECYKTFQNMYSSIYNNARRDVINSLKKEIDEEEENVKNEILKLIEKLNSQKRMAEKEIYTMQKRVEELSSEEEKERNEE